MNRKSTGLSRRYQAALRNYLQPPPPPPPPRPASIRRGHWDAEP